MQVRPSGKCYCVPAPLSVRLKSWLQLRPGGTTRNGFPMATESTSTPEANLAYKVLY